LIAGLDFQGIVSKVIAQNTLKRDFNVIQSALAPVVRPDGQLVAAIPFANGDTLAATTTDHARGQVLTAMQIPTKFADLLVADGLQSTLERVVNDRLGLAGNTIRKVRAYRDIENPNKLTMRAFLSDRYRALDYIDTMMAIAPKFNGSSRLKIKSSQVTETHLYIQAVDETAYRAVKGSKVADDLIAPGLVIRTSEVGSGALSVESLYFRKVCDNGMILQNVFRKAHVGVRNAFGGEGPKAFEVDFSDETKMLTDAAVYAQLSDTIDAAINEANFGKVIEKLEGLTQVELPAPQFAVETFATENGLAESEKERMLMHFIQGADTTLYGFWNAITRTAEDAKNYERAIELEKVGGAFLTADHRSIMKSVN
jgi:hypothetical protein